MNGFRVMGRVIASGTMQTARRWFWWQAARDLTGAQRAGTVAMRLVGMLCLAGFGTGFLWALGIIWYVLVAGWFVCIGVFADLEVGTDLALPSPTDDPYLEDEEADQEVVVERGRIGKAPVLKVHDPKNPAMTHLVWLGRAPRKEAS
jgi:hypothetical protein